MSFFKSARRFKPTKDREDIEWTNTWVEKSRDFKCSRVLLIGDSNPREYRRYLQNFIGKPVDFIGTSSLWMDPCFKNIFKAFFKRKYKYSVIFLELGTYTSSFKTKDSKKDKEKYKKEFKKFVKYLKKKQKNIIVISSKPRRCINDIEKYDEERNKETIFRNRIQRHVAEKQNLKFINTYDFILNANFAFRDNLHFRDRSADEAVAKYI